VDYPLPYVLLVGFLAILSGANTWVEMNTFTEAYKKKLNGILPNYKEIGIPSHDTYRRVFGIVDPQELQKAVTAFLVSEVEQMKKALGINEKGPEQYCIDGKEEKGTGRKYNTPEKIRNLQTLHCYNTSNGICLYNIPINKKTNEIPTAQELLKEMELKNCIVTFDAMNTQRDTVAIIKESHGDYVGGLKGNHETLHNEVAKYFTEEKLKYIERKGKNYRMTTEKAHNQIEKRSYYMTTDVKWFKEIDQWANLKAFICYDLETENLVTGKKTKERRYYIASPTDIELCADAIRGHWGVENQLHWHLDYTFEEDDNTTMDKNAFNNFSILSKMALTLLKLIQPAYKHKIGLKSIRKDFGWDLTKQLIMMLSLLDEDMIAEAMQKPVSKKK